MVKNNGIGKWLSFEKVNYGATLIAGIIILLMTLLVTWSVFVRYFMRSPWAWINEVTEYLQLLVAFFPAAWVLLNDGHIKVDILITRFSERTQNIVNLIIYSFCFIFSVILCWKTGEAFIKAYKLSWHSLSVLRIPLSPIYIWMVIFSFFLAWACLYKIRRYWLTLKKK